MNDYCKKQKWQIRLTLTAIFVCFSFLTLNAQEKTFSYNYENAVLKGVLNTISKDSGYKFMYIDEINAESLRVNLKCTDKSLNDVCNLLFSQLSINYTFKDNHIILAKGIYGKEPVIKRVRGKVTEKGEPLAYVNVMVEGTNNWTTTDEEGVYSLDIPGGDISLTFTLYGMKTEKVPVNGRSVIDLSMTTDSLLLDEIVVVGYGTQKKKDITSSISRIKGEDIAEKASSSFIQQMAGRASGVQVTTTGLIGATPRVIIRGVNSISSGTAPLYVINGVPVTSGGLGGDYTNNNAMGDINPADIESFEVLKDGAATAIYGSRAANGVVLVTTKQGKKGSVKVTYDGWAGIAKATQLYSVLNAEEFVEISNEKFANVGQSPKAFMDENNTDTDWVGQVYRTAFQHSHTLSITGGMDKTTFYTSIGYTNQEGICRDNDFARYSYYGKADHKMFNDVINIGFSVNASAQNNHSPKKGTSLLSDNVYCSTKLLPNVPIYDEADPTGYNIDDQYRKRLGRGANLISMTSDYPNIVWVLDHNFCKNNSYRLLPTAYIDITPVKGLTNRFLVSADVSALQNRYNQNPESGDGAGRGGLVNETWYRRERWTMQDILSYTKEFGNHHLDLTGVAEWTHYLSEYSGAEVTNLSDAFYSSQIVTDTFTNMLVEGGATQNGLTSYIFRANYNYNSTYYIGGSVRYDGLSKLYVDNRWGVFYGFSGALRASNLKFWKDGKIGKYLTEFRLRGSYAQVGNDDIGNFAYSDSFGADSYGTQSALGYTQVGNRDLKWEKQNIIDLGFDLTYRDKVNLTFAYWAKNNKDIVLEVPTAPSLGAPGNSINQNYGDIDNHGIEMELSGVVIDHSDFFWKSSINFSTQHSMVKRLVSDILSGNDFLLLRENEEMYTVYVVEYAGVNMSNGNPMYYKADGSIIQCNPLTGKYYEYDEADPTAMTTKSNLTSDDKKKFGTVIPKWFGGFDNTFSYKNWDLNIFFRFSGGNKIVNNTKRNMQHMGFQNNSKDVLNRWQSVDNPGDGQMPKLYYDKTSSISYLNCSRWVEDGDFLRLQNIQLGYSFPKKICDKLMLQKCKVYLQAQNVWTFTKYSGLDPESYTTAMGIDRTGEPQPTQILLGLSIGF